ncbi:hypothetical protein [Nocardioides sp.]|uniref:hypothetical protein n=1 Tax=Nocardioides sp. TaxID=35761 RepID=UPI0025FFACD0|nr:hypothetical protein [Nocardioides sp.]
MAYAIWSGVGTALVAVVGMTLVAVVGFAFLGESLGWMKVLSLAMTVGGVVGLNLAGAR